jgi:hypothetical protein
MPVSHSANALAANNQQPTFEHYWEPFGVDPTSAGAIAFPNVAGAGAWVPGALLAFSSAGVGSYPPLGYGAASNQGGDSGNSGNPTFPNNWTVPVVDLAPVSTTTLLAGVLLGVGAPGSPAPAVPNTVGSDLTPSLIAMVAKKGLVQVLVDNTTTIGHTINPSTTSTHTGQASDSGGTTFTAGLTIGVVLQAVTVSAGPLPCWVKLNIG